MAKEGFKHKLTAILCADVEGYSRLMDQNEDATIQTIKIYRSSMTTIINQHRGRVVDTTGDNLMAEFTSAVDAVNCAVEIQRELAERNAELPYERKMEFRIGVNVGDVVEEEDRIYGDGVNIAARVEAMAEAGGICITGRAYDQVANKLGLEYENLGEHQVKNISTPIRVYRVLSYPGGATHRVVQAKDTFRRKSRKIYVSIAGSIVFCLVAAFFLWNNYFRLPAIERMPEENRVFNLSEGPSVAVLPFVNMSGDPEQDYFSDGLTENIITGLSRCPRLLVIARNSTFTYKGQPIKIQKVARELGVEYVVEGSVQKTKDRVRITAQLIDAASGHHLWAEKFDEKFKDIFMLQDEITLKLVSALEVQLTEGEQARLRLKGPSNLEAYMKGLKGLQYIRRFNKDDIIKARQNAEEAIALAPNFAGYYVLLAATHLQDIRFSSTSSPLISFAKATENLNKAFALDKDNSDAYLVLGILYLVKGQHDKAIAAEEKAIALNPNGADAYCQLAFILLMSGQFENALVYVNKAMRLNPNPPGYYFEVAGYAYSWTEQYEEAIYAFKEAIDREPTIIMAHVGLAGVYIKVGMEKEAREEVAEVYRIDPQFSLSNFPFTDKDPERVKEVIDTLQKAGLE